MGHPAQLLPERDLLGDAARLSISSATNNIKYFTIATDEPLNSGVGFSNIVWTCN
jgi:hypothetical protein